VVDYFIPCVAENEILKYWLFCKPIDIRAMSLEVFSLIDGFLGKNEINWENCVGHCIVGAQSLSGKFQDFCHL
jgi:hypothetical protein